MRRVNLWPARVVTTPSYPPTSLLPALPNEPQLCGLQWSVLISEPGHVTTCYYVAHGVCVMNLTLARLREGYVMPAVSGQWNGQTDRQTDGQAEVI